MKIVHADIQVGDVINVVEDNGAIWQGPVMEITTLGTSPAVKVSSYIGKTCEDVFINNGGPGILLTNDKCVITLIKR